MCNWTWPLPGIVFQSLVLDPDHPGSFGAVRRHDRHTGVDLYCPEGSLVVACEDGVITEIDDFTGPKADSPWWLETMSILIEGESGAILYGEIDPLDTIHVNDHVRAGQPIGHVRRVLKKDKGKPMSMLHLELYKHGALEAVWWHLGDEKPELLLDPTEHLRGFESLHV